MAVAGSSTSLYTGGTPTAVTGEPAALVSGKTYRITDAARRVIDWRTAVTVEDDGAAVAASDIESIDYLHGRVTFAAGYTPTTPITLDYSYVPRLRFAEAHNVDQTIERAKIVSTVFTPGVTNPSETSFAGLLTFSATIGTLSPLRTDLDPDGDGLVVATVVQSGAVIYFEDEDKGRRVVGKLHSASDSASVDGRVEGSFEFHSTVEKALDGTRVTFSQL
jgi:hypothetical protein